MNWPGVTPFSLVCLRFDDYHQNIDHETWLDVLSHYDERGLSGLIAVCPAFKGEPLSEDVVPFLKELESNGWELAQHGYAHEDVGEGRGGVLYDERSEFAGLPYEEQHRRIAAGHDILVERGIEPTTFVPPWHECDRTTLCALAEEGFTCVNEGRWPIPRTIEGVTLVPTHVPGVTPAMVSVGVVTFVEHPHLDDTPLATADLLASCEGRLRTPGEIAAWWRQTVPF